MRRLGTIAVLALAVAVAAGLAVYGFWHQPLALPLYRTQLKRRGCQAIEAPDTP